MAENTRQASPADDLDFYERVHQVLHQHFNSATPSSKAELRRKILQHFPAAKPEDIQLIVSSYLQGMRAKCGNV